MSDAVQTSFTFRDFRLESGETLRQNGLTELEFICPISSVIVANRVALKLKRAAIGPLLEALRESA